MVKVRREGKEAEVDREARVVEVVKEGRVVVAEGLQV